MRGAIEFRSQYLRHDPLNTHGQSRLLESILAVHVLISHWYRSASHLANNDLPAAPLQTPNVVAIAYATGFGQLHRASWSSAFGLVPGRIKCEPQLAVGRPILCNQPGFETVRSEAH